MNLKDALKLIIDQEPTAQAKLDLLTNITIESLNPETQAAAHELYNEYVEAEEILG